MDYVLLAQNLSIVLCFLAGVLSFFSPCVIPLMPIYLSVLGGSTESAEKPRSPLLNTLGFALGVSSAFFLLGLAFTGLGQLLSRYHDLMVKAGSIAIFVVGVWMLLPQKSFLGEKRFDYKVPQIINPFRAALMGFFFSFAWTPCVGPLLSSALIMTTSAQNIGLGLLYIGVYSLGFILPFLLFSAGANKLFSKIPNKEKFFKVMHKVAGVLMLVIAISMYNGWFNNLSAKLSQYSGLDALLTQESGKQEQNKPGSQASPQPQATQSEEKQAAKDDDSKHPIAPDFELTGMDGKQYKLSDFRGKRVFLNFWATWCPPCRAEMPHIQQLYENYQGDDYAILTVTNPRSEEYPNNADITEDGITSFVKSREFSFPVLFDTTQKVFRLYGIRSFPTTYIIDADGRVEGYVPSAMSYELMESILTGQSLQ